VIQKSEFYSRLVESVANYYTLMELSKDLIQRVQLYGLDFGQQNEDFQENLKKFSENWMVNQNKNIAEDLAK